MHDVAGGDDRRRPILLGEAPSQRGDAYHHFPLSGPPARVLCQLAGIPPQPAGSTYGRWTWALYERFDCRNLIERYADATPWPTATARERARQLLAELEAENVKMTTVSSGMGTEQEEHYRQLTGTPLVQRMTIAPPPVIVCLGRRVQAAMFAALEGDVTPARSRGGAWGTLFGDFGVWAAPWQIHVPVTREGVIDRQWAPHVVTIPHPSGLNRSLNADVTRARTGEVLQRALELAAGDDAP